MDDDRTPDGGDETNDADDADDADDANDGDDGDDGDEAVEQEFAQTWMAARGEAPEDAYYVSRACGCVEFYSAGASWRPCSDHPGVTAWDRLA